MQSHYERVRTQRPHSRSNSTRAARTVALVLAVAAIGCGGSNLSETPAPNDLLGLGVGASAAVDALAVSFEARAHGLSSIALISPVLVNGVAFQDSHYVLYVPLAPGPQELRFRGQFTDGRQVEQAVTVVNSLAPSNAVKPLFQPSICVIGSSLIALVGLRDDIAPPTEALLDLNGDSRPEARVAFDELLAATAPGVGAHTPRVCVRLANGVWLASAPESPALLTCLPNSGASQSATWLPGDAVDALVGDPLSDGILALSSSSATIRHIAPDGSTTSTTVLGGAVSPSGFCTNDAGDWFVAETGANRIRRYNAALAWQLDVGFGVGGALGTSGSAPGQLLAPLDVAVTVDPRDDALRVWVADTGNARVQVFDTSGALRQVLLGNEEGGTAFVSPTRLRGFGDGVAVLDSGAGLVRVFDARGNPSFAWGQGAPPSSAVLASPADLAVDAESGALALLDTQSNRVCFVDTFGGLKREFEVPSDARSLCFTKRSDGIRLAVGAAAPSGIRVFDLESDAPGQSPVEVVSQTIVQLLAGDDAHALELFDEGLGADVRAALADPSSRAQFLATIGQLEVQVEIARREPYAQVATASTTGDPAVTWTLRRRLGSGPWRIHSF